MFSQNMPNEWPEMFAGVHETARYLDLKIDGADRVILGDPFADFTYGITNRFGYKDFSLEIYIQGVQGIENFSNLAAESLYPINKERNHLAIHYLDRWRTSNTNAVYPSGVNYTSYSDGTNKVNTYTVQDASFMRIKNITLNYNLPLDNVDFIKSGKPTLSTCAGTILLASTISNGILIAEVILATLFLYTLSGEKSVIKYPVLVSEIYFFIEEMASPRLI